ncbi:MAG: hypothetical protein KGS73_19315, partial [Chloroflexi bacterium]|nr:hypothetical protein [Chloroflexota bacterium]
FDTSASPDRRAAEARFVHGHLLKPGDVARTSPRLRCAQPPYDTLPIPRADLPAGVILAREADAWICEEQVEDVALPFMQGAMLHQFDFSQKGWISGTGLQAKWNPIDWSNKYVDPQFLMAAVHATGIGLRTLHRRVARNTDARTMIASLSWSSPAGDKAPVLSTRSSMGDIVLVGILNSFVFDRLLRDRCGSTNIDLTSLEAMPLPSRQSQALEQLLPPIIALNGASPIAASSRLFVIAKLHAVFQDAPRLQAIGVADRLRARVVIDTAIVHLFNLNHKAVAHLLNNCDLATDDLTQRNMRATLDPKGFWRVDKDKDPELRHTVLTLIAFHDLEAKIREHGGDRDAGIAAFLAQNHGEGWLLPETLRLADYGLGHDERAQHHQPVASRLGPRFYDWQLTQSAEESWRECHLHARNLLGETGYRNLLADIEAERSGTRPISAAPPPVAGKGDDTQQMNLFN